MDKVNLDMDDAEDDGMFVPTGGRQPQALLLSSPDSMCTQLALRTVCTMGLRLNLRTNISDTLTTCAPELIWPVTVIQRLQHSLSARYVDMLGWRAVGKLDLPTLMDRHGQWNSASDENSLFYYLGEYVKHHAKDMFTVFGASCDALDERFVSERVLLVSSIDMLARVLGLLPHERALLLFAFLVKYKRGLHAVMVNCEVAHSQEAFRLLASLAGASTAEVAASLRLGSRLEALGLIRPPLPEDSVTGLGDLMRISDCLPHVLLGDYACKADMMAVFTRPAPSTTLSQSDYPHMETDTRYLAALLENASQ